MPIDTPTLTFFQLITLVGVASIGSFARFCALPGKNRWHDLSLTFGNLLLGVLVGFLCREKTIWDVKIFEISTAIFAVAGKEIIKWGILAMPMILNWLLKIGTTSIMANINKNKQDENRTDTTNP